MNQKINLEKSYAAMEEASTETLDALIKVLEAAMTRDENVIEQAIRETPEEQLKQICKIMRAGVGNE